MQRAEVQRSHPGQDAMTHSNEPERWFGLTNNTAGQTPSMSEMVTKSKSSGTKDRVNKID